MNDVKTLSGHNAWVAIKKWYGLDATLQTIIDHYRSKSNSLKLDGGSLASPCLNNLIMFGQNLEAKIKSMTTKTNWSTLLDRITDDNYIVIKQQLMGDMTKDFDYFVTRVLQREQ